MKLSLYLLICILSTFICCQRSSDNFSPQIKTIQVVIDCNPDSAATLIEKISYPDLLTKKDYAQYMLLKCRIADSIQGTLPASKQIIQAEEWFIAKGSYYEKALIKLYHGRALMKEGAFNDAMTYYTQALHEAEKGKCINLEGYIYSYMGDLYQERAMLSEAERSYETAYQYFKRADNITSSIIALKDKTRIYAFENSLDKAFKTLFMADSMSRSLHLPWLESDIQHYLGNLYSISGDLEKAKYYLLMSLSQKKVPNSNYLGLIEIYLKQDSVTKAKEYLSMIPETDSECIRGYHWCGYLINKRENRYSQALDCLEKYNTIRDSMELADHQSRIMEIEKLYNDSQQKRQIESLKGNRQILFLIIVICMLFLALSVTLFINYRKVMESKIKDRNLEIAEIKNSLLATSQELNQKEEELNKYATKSSEEEIIKGDIASLKQAYKKLQLKLITSSPIYKELYELSQSKAPSKKETMINKKKWEQIELDIMTIYPSYRAYIFNVYPQISDKEWQYCCFFMYGFDVNAEAKLLNINPNSVRIKHSRMREKLKIVLPEKCSLHEYLIVNIL
jgi:hypothetical protein